MGLQYQAVGWNRQKRIYDGVLLLSVLFYLAGFVGLGFALHPDATAETILIRALGTCAITLLHVILAIGPLARLDRRFLPLLYNRRHLGVTMFMLALAHGGFSLFQFHASGNTNPIVSLLTSNPRFDSLSQFPFQPLGFLALITLFSMAATSHDFWLKNLSAPVWKTLHMGVYFAYALIVMHVVLGVLQAETSLLYPIALGIGALTLIALHLAAGRERLPGTGGTDGWIDAGQLSGIPENRAKIVDVAGERVAVFRYDGKLSAISNVCQHQNGPLGEGRVIDGLVTCPWHGYQYKPDCGRSPEPFDERVPTFKVEVRDGRVWVEDRAWPAGTPQEPALIPKEEPDPPASDDGEPYIGYLPKAPAPLASWLKPRVALAVLLFACLALGLTAAQRPFSKAVFEYGHVRTFEGWIESEPLPTLLVERPGSGDEDRVSRYLLSGLGKFGALPEIEGFEGRHVRLQGTLVYSGETTMIEIDPGSVGSSGKNLSRPAAESWSEDLGLHTLLGEIVDSKCYLGVMKPGNLKPHRACATRCISGGVPPVLLVRQPDDTALYVLLTGTDGSAVNHRILDKIAEPVEITGQLLRYDNLLVMRSDPASYRRIE